MYFQVLREKNAKKKKKENQSEVLGAARVVLGWSKLPFAWLFASQRELNI